MYMLLNFEMCECYWRPKMRSFLFIYTLNSIISFRDEMGAQWWWHFFLLQSTNGSAPNLLSLQFPAFHTLFWPLQQHSCTWCTPTQAAKHFLYVKKFLGNFKRSCFLVTKLISLLKYVSIDNIKKHQK